MALACDLIVASDRAVFADTHARVGLLPGWGLSQRLPRLIGVARAKELAFTGNQITAQQANDWGVVNRVVTHSLLLEQCWQLAEDMCSCEANALVEYKALIDKGMSMHFDDALRYDAEKGIEAAANVSAETVAQRKGAIFDRGKAQRKQH